VVGDPTLGLGDAMVETVDSVIDARISDALDRVREVLQP
jgi:flagellar biosynthesis/type III secretory pathway protein FliH